jgi:hypothetical protein
MDGITSYWNCRIHALLLLGVESKSKVTPKEAYVALSGPEGIRIQDF